ncbi:hypothetical protein ACDY96_04595 [Rhizobium mongolense]|uniref:hypothetical protein n=1 Tax=Rhizobium mongolense TaxID=57676 RepID=UPI0035562AEF
MQNEMLTLRETALRPSLSLAQWSKSPADFGLNPASADDQLVAATMTVAPGQCSSRTLPLQEFQPGVQR